MAPSWSIFGASKTLWNRYHMHGAEKPWCGCCRRRRRPPSPSPPSGSYFTKSVATCVAGGSCRPLRADTAHGNLGNLLRDVKKDYGGAEQEYRTAIRLDPENEVAHRNLGVLLKDDGECEVGPGL